MERRGFLKLFSVGIAGLALEQAIPFGRVWSFPKNIVIAPSLDDINTRWINMEILLQVKKNLRAASDPFGVYWELPVIRNSIFFDHGTNFPHASPTVLRLPS